MLTGCGYHCLRLCYLQLDELSSVADLVVIFGPVYEISKSLYSHTFDAFSLLDHRQSDSSLEVWHNKCECRQKVIRERESVCVCVSE